MPAHQDADTTPQPRPPLPSPGNPVAWDAPTTRRAWRRHTVRAGLALVAWIAGWFVLLGITRDVYALASVVFIPYTFCAPYPVLTLLLAELPGTVRMRRTLRRHPWQLIEGAEHGLAAHPAAARDSPWFAVPDPEAPDDPDARLPLLLSGPRTRWWTRRMRTGASTEQRAEIGVLWCCGDPRADVVIAASAHPGAGKTPRRLVHLQQRHALVAGRRHRRPADPASADPVLPDDPRPALSHPPTARTMRSRMRRRLLLLLVWPALLAVQVTIVATDDYDRIGVLMCGVLLQLTALPMHICVLVSTRRMTRLLAAHAWRPVDCTVRMRGKAQLITVDGRVLTPSPWRTYVDGAATRLWIAGDIGSRCMASAPGGARPVSLAPTP
ncbi:hypothetical protein [Streptomyces sp. Je 1-332]|uniref:hypothetical protein n=1 Tax=Streptomyces sp. Je 1-332 TaxID=3231270 RepID=UPI0034592953